MHARQADGKVQQKNVWIHNNIFYDVGKYEEVGWTCKGIIIGYWNNTTIENNIFDNAGNGAIYSGKNIDANIFSSDVYTTIRNNIFYNTQYLAGRAIEIDDTHQHFNVFNNDFYQNKVDFYGSGITQSNNILTDPKFADAANRDYHLQSDSPFIGAGLNGVDIGAQSIQIVPTPTPTPTSEPVVNFTASPTSERISHRMKFADKSSWQYN